MQNAVLAIVNPSVHLSVCPSHAGTVSKRLELRSCGLLRTRQISRASDIHPYHMCASILTGENENVRARNVYKMSPARFIHPDVCLMLWPCLQLTHVVYTCVHVQRMGQAIYCADRRLIVLLQRPETRQGRQ